MKVPDHGILTEQNIAVLTANLRMLAPEKRLLLVRDVLAAARMALGAPLRGRELAILKQLRELRKTASTRPMTTEEIPDDVCPALGIEHPSELADLLNSPGQFVSALDAAISEFSTFPETVQNCRGGRRRDPRIDNFAYRLARIYSQYMGAWPSFTQDKETGDLTGPFGLFAEEAFHLLFIPHLTVGEGQIREALRAAIDPDPARRARRGKAGGPSGT